jgi:hypothetical protein
MRLSIHTQKILDLYNEERGFERINASSLEGGEPAQQTQPISAKTPEPPGFPWNLRENALRCILLELPGNSASVDLLRITRLESYNIAGNWLQMLRERA